MYKTTLFTLLAAVFIALFIFLGNWQLNRAAEKATMLTEARLAKKIPAFEWLSAMPNPAQYTAIKVSGEYTTPVFLLDNQYHAHQWGYHVIQPLQMVNDQILLVDRGWVVGDVKRLVLPEISIPKGQLMLKGQAYYPSEKVWVLGQEMEKKTDNLVIIERINPKLIGDFLHKSVYPFIIRLDQSQADTYLRDWPIVSMQPARHKAYAFQWFSMAFAIFVIYISLMIKTLHEKKKT